jgi:hypothetical protein
LKPIRVALISPNHEVVEEAVDSVFELDAVSGEFVAFKVILEIGWNEPAPVDHLTILEEKAGERREE